MHAKCVKSFNISTLLQRKKFLRLLAEFNKPACIADWGIELQTAWIFKNIYKITYFNSSSYSNLARQDHGIQHVSRVALYIPIWANIYRLFNVTAALQLTDAELKLIQIAALLHDSAREDDNEDKWEHESGCIVYWYLIRKIQISPLLAKQLAEAVANKDWEYGQKYYVLEELDNTIRWSLDKNHYQPRNIYQKLIHDADCLDIMRVQSAFDGRYLDFYNDIAKLNAMALDVMAEFILQARSLIFKQGDYFNQNQPFTKKIYETSKCFLLMRNDIRHQDYLFMAQLYAGNHLLPSKQLATLTLLKPSLPLIFARGILAPSALSVYKPTETLAALELRKVKRRKNILTTTSKKDGLNKEGNPNRSVTKLGNGSWVFADAGYLILNVDTANIKSIHLVDADTGYGKKQVSKENTVDLLELIDHLKLGGPHKTYTDVITKHHEILYDVKQYDAIYYTTDPNFASDWFFNTTEPSVNATILKAVYLQFEYKNTFGKILPIYEYSAIHNRYRAVATFSDEQIVALWVKVCEAIYFANSKHMELTCLKNTSIAEIQIKSLYANAIDNNIFCGFKEASYNYPQPLQLSVNEAISNLKEKYIKSIRRLVSTMGFSNNTYLTNDTFFKSIRLDDELLASAKSQIEKNLIEHTAKLHYKKHLNSDEITLLVRGMILMHGCKQDITPTLEMLKRKLNIQYTTSLSQSVINALREYIINSALITEPTSSLTLENSLNKFFFVKPKTVSRRSYSQFFPSKEIILNLENNFRVNAII